MNSLVGSLFVYKMNVLNSIPHEVANAVDKMVCNFMWNEGSAKIAMNTLKRSKKKQGGLKLFDVRLKDTALKVQWVQTYFNNIEIRVLADACIKYNIAEKIWQGNLQEHHVHLFVKPGFWCDVLKAWSKYAYNEPRNKTQVLAQPIWLNSNITINNRPLFNEIAWNSGLKHIRDLFDDNNKLESYARVINLLLDTTSYVQLYGIYESISIEWRRLMSANSGQVGGLIDDKLVVLLSEDHISQYVYNVLIDELGDLDYKRAKRNCTLSLNLTKNDYYMMFKRICGITNHSKLRSFQYNILQFGIVTNRKAHFYGLRNNDKCSFCKDQPENQIHLFYQCPYAQTFFREVVMLIDEIAPSQSRKGLFRIEKSCLMKYLHIQDVYPTSYFLWLKAIYTTVGIKMRL